MKPATQALSAFEIAHLDAIEFPEYTKTELREAVQNAVDAVLKQMKKEGAESAAELRIQLCALKEENNTLKSAQEAFNQNKTDFEKQVFYIHHVLYKHVEQQEMQSRELTELKAENTQLRANSHELRSRLLVFQCQLLKSLAIEFKLRFERAGFSDHLKPHFLKNGIEDPNTTGVLPHFKHSIKKGVMSMANLNPVNSFNGASLPEIGSTSTPNASDKEKPKVNGASLLEAETASKAKASETEKQKVSGSPSESWTVIKPNSAKGDKLNVGEFTNEEMAERVESVRQAAEQAAQDAARVERDSERKRHEEEKETLNRKITDLTDANSSKDQTIESLKSTVQASEQSNTQKSAENSDLKNRVTALTTENDSLKTKNDSLNVEKSKAEKQYSDLQSDMKAREERQEARHSAEVKASEERQTALHSAAIKALEERHTVEMKALTREHAENLESRIKKVNDEHALKVDSIVNQLLEKHSADLKTKEEQAKMQRDADLKAINLQASQLADAQSQVVQLNKEKIKVEALFKLLKEKLNVTVTFKSLPGDKDENMALNEEENKELADRLDSLAKSERSYEQLTSCHNRLVKKISKIVGKIDKQFHSNQFLASEMDEERMRTLAKKLDQLYREMDSLGGGLRTIGRDFWSHLSAIGTDAKALFSPKRRNKRGQQPLTA